ncbi:MAG: helix-turn-helix domain-containing protein [Phycisphaerae bacterium]|nr:helix-turn-helix domain-containing protein [Phycisphaerae bacterium]
MERHEIDPQPDALTVRETARRLSVSQMTVWRLLARGVLIRVRVGRAVRILARSVEQFVERGGVGR